MTIKPWYLSKTVWGSLVAILAALAGIFDVDLDAADQARAVDMIVQAIGALGGLIALVGRFRATQRIA